MSEELINGIDRLGLELEVNQIDQLSRLLADLMKWNQAYNLTAIKDESEAVKLHLLDSLAVVPFWRFEKTLDVGTGAGFPGLPLAIALPGQEFHLLDSNSKKIRFIRQQVHALGLDNVKVFHSRVQEHKPENYQAITSRAFASLVDMVNWTDPLLPAGAVWMAMKGAYSKQEIDELPESVTEVNTRFLKVPGLEAQRCLIELKRTND